MNLYTRRINLIIRFNQHFQSQFIFLNLNNIFFGQTPQ